MTDNTKIELSKLELELMKDQEWILTKHNVMEKVSSMFSAQVGEIGRLFSKPCSAFEEIISAKPKISKGERYQDLPWLILDYPAVFSKEDIFALRIMFLWGNFISVTLHLSGKYKIFFQQNIINRINFEMEGLYMGIGEDQWQQHFDTGVYTETKKTNRADSEKHIMQHPFLKIVLRCGLGQVGEMDDTIKKSCHYMAGLL